MSTYKRAEVLWRDRKRCCGFPVCFMRYEVTADRVMFTEGGLNERIFQVLLRNVKNVAAERSFSQRVFGVGTVILTTYDGEVYKLENISKPLDVKEFLHEEIEEQKRLRRYQYRGYDVCDEWQKTDLSGQFFLNRGLLY